MKFVSTYQAMILPFKERKITISVSEGSCDERNIDKNAAHGNKWM
jgi:hypothetical protein